MLEARYLGFIVQEKEIKLFRGINEYDFQMEKGVLTLEPVMVTAQRREENLQIVPISMTVLESEEIKKRNIDRIIDLQNSIPNFFLGDGTFNRRAFSSIRGIAGASRASGVETRANYYIDDVYLGRSVAVNQDLVDLERIELLKGPQGTLFGKNTVSGVISITTRKPINAWEGIVSVEVGNLNYINSSVVINAPLINNKLFTRFSGKIFRRDGYVTNLYNNTDMNGQNLLNGKFQIRYLPTPSIDINLSIDALRDRRDRRTGGIALDTYGYEVAPGPREVSHDYPESENRDIFGASLNINYMMKNNYNLKSVTAYRSLKNNGSLDEDLSPLDYYVGVDSENDEHFTQELRLTSPSFNNVNFICGLFYFYQKSNQTFQVTGTPEAPLTNFYLYADGPVTTNSVAGYFHGNYYLTDNLSIYGGIRYTYEFKEINWTQINTPPIVIYENIENYEDTYSKGVFSPQIGLRYEPLNHTDVIC